jgi:hypothetical protein
MRLLTALILALSFSTDLLAADWPKAAPKEANTSEEIKKVVGSKVGFGPVNRAEFRSHGRELLALWYCPTSGEAACYLQAWYCDPEKSKWIQFINRRIGDTHDLSVELPVQGEDLVFKDFRGKVVLRESIAKVPAKNWEKE